jgi:hypothetical protein
MKILPTNFYRLLSFALILVALTGAVWLQASANPVAAQEPETEEPVLSILVIPDGDGFSVANLGTTPVFEVGDTFKVSIVALGIIEPGIFGSQFEIAYNTDHLAAVEGSLVSGEAMEPVVTAVSNIDNAAGRVAYAASRQGDVENLTGNVVLATFGFEAVGATEPPEGQTTLIDLQNVKLGAKGGVEVPVSNLVDLEIIIREGDDTTPGVGDIAGNVKVESRDDDNQAGHSIAELGGLLTPVTTGTNGDFFFNNVATGTYTLFADSPGFLAATCADVSHSADALTNLADAVLLAGDIDGNGEIDITDAVAIGAVLGSTDPGEIADLNADVVVDILDLIVMAVNFGQTSAGNPWICQLPAEL